MADADEMQAPEVDTPAPVDEAETTPAPKDDAPAPDAATPETDVKPDDAKGIWPDDWRSEFAGGDEKELKTFERYRSPVDVAKALRAAQKKISSGDLKPVLPDDATEEQVAEYRKANGIPETPDGYLESLPDGLVIGDDDKPVLESYLKDIHGDNAPPGFVAKTLDWYYRNQEEAAANIAESDKAYEAASTDKLREEWGGEYRGNINAAKAWLASAPSDENGTPLAELLMGARLADGTTFGSNPTALRWLVDQANKENPAGFVSPGAGGSQIESVEAEIASIEKTMREDRPAYDKNPEMRARLRTLYDAQAKLAAK